MTTDDKIRDEKLRCDFNREAAKISALPYRKIEYLTEEKIIPRDQRRIIKQASFANCPLGKVFEKQLKAIEDHGWKKAGWSFNSFSPNLGGLFSGL